MPSWPFLVNSLLPIVWGPELLFPRAPMQSSGIGVVYSTLDVERGCPQLCALHSPVLSVPAPAPQEYITPQLHLGALTADNVGPRSLDLSWTVEEGTFDSFIIHYRDAAGQAQALPVDGVLRSLHLHDLTPSHQYRFNLYGISGRKRLGPISTNAITGP